MISSCSRSPSPIVRFLLLWMPDVLGSVVIPALLASAGLSIISLASSLNERESDNRSNFPELVSASQCINMI